MGNCRSVEVANMVVIQHHGANAMVERFYSSLSVQEVMSSNPGHYIAHVFDSTIPSLSNNGSCVKQLKLLRPDDTLHLGHVYRLIPFEDVLTLFAAKKSVKLGNMPKQCGTTYVDKKKKFGVSGSPQVINNNNIHFSKVDIRLDSGIVTNCGGNGSGGRSIGQWKPTLQSIAEA